MITMTAKKTAAAPAKAEATAAPIEFDYEGEHYTVTRESADNLEIFEHIEDGDYIIAVRALLGGGQWLRFKDSQRDEKTGTVALTSFEPFLDAVMVAIGGNSEASPAS